MTINCIGCDKELRSGDKVQNAEPETLCENCALTWNDALADSEGWMNFQTQEPLTYAYILAQSRSHVAVGGSLDDGAFLSVLS